MAFVLYTCVNNIHIRSSTLPVIWRCVDIMLQLQCESKKSRPGVIRIFSFFHKRLRIFNRFFTHLLHVPMYARLQIFIQLSPTLTKLCHIKHDYLVHIICAKFPKRAKTRAFRRLRKSMIALLIVFWSVASHYKINTFMMSTNMSDMTWCQQWRHLLKLRS